MEQDFACGVCSCIFDFDAHAAYNHTGCVFKIGKKCLDELLEKSNNCQCGQPIKSIQWSQDLSLRIRINRSIISCQNEHKPAVRAQWLYPPQGLAYCEECIQQIESQEFQFKQLEDVYKQEIINSVMATIYQNQQLSNELKQKLNNQNQRFAQDEIMINELYSSFREILASQRDYIYHDTQLTNSARPPDNQMEFTLIQSEDHTKLKSYIRSLLQKTSAYFITLKVFEAFQKQRYQLEDIQQIQKALKPGQNYTGSHCYLYCLSCKEEFNFEQRQLILLKCRSEVFIHQICLQCAQNQLENKKQFTCPIDGQIFKGIGLQFKSELKGALMPQIICYEYQECNTSQNNPPVQLQCGHYCCKFHYSQIPQPMSKCNVCDEPLKVINTGQFLNEWLQLTECYCRNCPQQSLILQIFNHHGAIKLQCIECQESDITIDMLNWSESLAKYIQKDARLVYEQHIKKNLDLQQQQSFEWYFENALALTNQQRVDFITELEKSAHQTQGEQDINEYKSTQICEYKKQNFFSLEISQLQGCQSVSRFLNYYSSNGLQNDDISWENIMQFFGQNEYLSFKTSNDINLRGICLFNELDCQNNQVKIQQIQMYKGQDINNTQGQLIQFEIVQQSYQNDLITVVFQNPIKVDYFQVITLQLSIQYKSLCSGVWMNMQKIQVGSDGVLFNFLPTFANEVSIVNKHFNLGPIAGLYYTKS